MKRIAFAGIVVFLALFLGTCEAALSDGGDNTVAEYSDWEYVVLPDGSARLTIQLDGTTPFAVTSGNRALNYGIAKRSHDYFEAVFIAAPGDATREAVARASWEIGQAAGITGVRRGVSYVSINPYAAAPNTPDGASIVCVGRKVAHGIGTLLAVGVLTHIDGSVITGSTSADGVILSTTKNVTFTVSALDTQVGFDFPTGTTIRDTFWTSATDTATGEAGLSVIPANNSKTEAGTAKFKNDATYTMFGLPSYKATLDTAAVSPDTAPDGEIIIGALYQIGGLNYTGTEVAAMIEPNGVFETGTTWATTGIDFSTALFVYPTGLTSGTPINTNFQVLERLAIYQTNGQTYDVIEANLDTETTVKLNTTATGLYVDTNNANFIPKFPLNFIVTPDSGGAFAFTFQVPVYALAKDTVTPANGPAPSTNGGGDGIKWYVRPAHGQPQYLLDDGKNAGGAVLIGVGVAGIDWLEIIVKGFGFPN
jgi:hypothetical protein